MGRLRDRSRRVVEITEVLDCRQDEYVLNPLFQFQESDGMLREEPGVYGEELISRVYGSLQKTGHRLMHRKKLQAAALELEE